MWYLHRLVNESHSQINYGRGHLHLEKLCEVIMQHSKWRKSLMVRDLSMVNGESFKLMSRFSKTHLVNSAQCDNLLWWTLQSLCCCKLFIKIINIKFKRKNWSSRPCNNIITLPQNCKIWTSSIQDWNFHSSFNFIICHCKLVLWWRSSKLKLNTFWWFNSSYTLISSYLILPKELEI